MTNEKWNEGAGHPMQSWEWGEFREKMGNRVSRIVGNKQYQIIWSRVFGNLWFGYVPMGPMPTEKDIRIMNQELGIRGIGIRFEPNVVLSAKYKVLRGLVPGRHLFKPKTYWVDLTKSEEELLKSMTSKCRYNIRLAQKHDVKIIDGDAEGYLNLMFGKTIKRQKIYAHSERYHNELMKISWTKLFKAEYQGKAIASWMIFAWKDFIYYAYGAFDEEYKYLMAPVLGLWEIAKWGKANGYKTFDLWGAEEGKGYSRFKEQFGPKLMDMAGTYDLPVSLFYWPFRIAEEIRWKILRVLK